MTWALDLDGVLWRGDRPVPGSAGAVAALRAGGERLVFLTNNSYSRVDAFVAKLERCGVRASADEIITSGQAAASMLEPGTTALVCAGPGVVEALEAVGVVPVHEGSADAVVVGWHAEFDYSRLTAAVSAVLGGARLVGTNDDATYPTADGLIPGGGSLLAAVAYASGTTPAVAGKPNAAMVALVSARVGPVAVMVGDRPDTDGLLARELGARYGLVLSGVTTDADLPVEPEPDLVAPDLASVVGAWAGLRAQE
ncbi:MAG TPA: HAD-IIA family hydrolase [Acidimicrobiales bacterium]|nr:HAD-IIA family hydrolase [Acidimicrobiales bacterium]